MIDLEVEYHVITEVTIHALIVTILDIFSHINGKIVSLLVIYWRESILFNLSPLHRLINVHGASFVHLVSMII